MENSTQTENTPRIYNKRIGTFTFGLTMILLGIAVFIQLFIPFELLRYMLMLWPIVFISLGIEAVVYTYKKDIKIKYDILGTILIFFLLTIGGIFSACNYAINNVLFESKFQNIIVDSKSSMSNSYDLAINMKCEIINLTDKPVNITIIKDLSNTLTNATHDYGEDEDTQSRGVAHVNMKYTLDKQTNILPLLTTQPYDFIVSNNDYSKLTIANLPSYVESVNMVIYAANPENITETNCNITNM